MKFLDRDSELGLNILQLMYATKMTKPLWTAGDTAAKLKESELYLHKVYQKLREFGYVYAIRGPNGGYKLHPTAETYDLKAYLEHFNRKYTPSSILNTDAASEVANQRITAFLYRTRLKDLFESQRAIPVIRIKTADWEQENGPPDPKGVA